MAYAYLSLLSCEEVGVDCGEGLRVKMGNSFLPLSGVEGIGLLHADDTGVSWRNRSTHSGQ